MGLRWLLLGLLASALLLGALAAGAGGGQGREGAGLERRLLSGREATVSVPVGLEEEFARRLGSDPAVEFVEPNRVRRAAFTPNDPFFKFQWHFALIQAGQAWEVSKGLNVRVAVVDTGVAYEDYVDPVSGATYAQAPDFKAAVFVAPWDFVHGDEHANDDNGHGTHVAGTIAESTNNSQGAAGLAFQ